MLHPILKNCFTDSCVVLLIPLFPFTSSKNKRKEIFSTGNVFSARRFWNWMYSTWRPASRIVARVSGNNCCSSPKRGLLSSDSVTDFMVWWLDMFISSLVFCISPFSFTVWTNRCCNRCSFSLKIYSIGSSTNIDWFTLLNGCCDYANGIGVQRHSTARWTQQPLFELHGGIAMFSAQMIDYSLMCHSVGCNNHMSCLALTCFKPKNKTKHIIEMRPCSVHYSLVRTNFGMWTCISHTFQYIKQQLHQ